MPLGLDHRHPGGMVENSPAFQRRDRGERAPSPAGTAEIERVSRPSGTYPSGTSNPALKRRAIIVRPSGTKTAPLTSNPSGVGRLARCFWPPAKAVCYRGLMLALTVRSRLRTIRRDAEWCERDARTPQVESSVSRVREPALYRRKAANCTKNEMRPRRD